MTSSFCFWISVALATFLYRKTYGNLFFIAAFPGTVAHELSHLIVALLLRGHPTGMNLIPVKDGNRWVLGSVTFYPNMWNGSFVALAPLTLLAFAYYLGLRADESLIRQQLIFGYIAGCCLNSCIPSGADWDIVAEYPVGFLVLLLFAVVFLHMY